MDNHHRTVHVMPAATGPGCKQLFKYSKNDTEPGERVTIPAAPCTHCLRPLAAKIRRKGDPFLRVLVAVNIFW